MKIPSHISNLLFDMHFCV